MIRPDLLRSVYEVLGSHKYLAIEDFSVTEYANKQGAPCLAIEYRYDKTLQFRFHIPAQRTKGGEYGSEAYRFHCTMRPGLEAVEEALHAEERAGLLSEIKAWLDRLYDDVVAAPAERRFQEHAKLIDEITSRLNSLPDEPLSKADVRAFNEGLENLKAELAEELRRGAKDKEELQQRVQMMTNDIEFLKTTLDSLTQRQWAELFVARVEKWKTRFSLRRISAGARVAKLLLPAGAGEALDGVAHVVDGIAAVVDGDMNQSTPDHYSAEDAT